ncbi:MAG: LysM peptidoglycan-binding domain-containing protein [Anaerolineales bacterium]
MNMRPALLALSLALILVAFALTLNALAAPAPQGQQFVTPTPGPDGRIIYIVRAGETCISISLLTGVPVDYLRTTNRLDENCTLREGQELVIGVGGPAGATPTVGPQPTPTVGEPTPTPVSGTAQVCVLLYADLNGDGLRQETETGIADGAVSVTSANGTYSQSKPTVALLDADTGEPVRTCFTDMPPGRYTISAAVPDAFSPTTVLTYTLEVSAGDTSYVGFGAQLKAQEETSPQPEGGSPILGIAGVILLLVGIGIALYAWRTFKR